MLDLGNMKDNGMSVDNVKGDNPRAKLWKHGIHNACLTMEA